MKKLHNSHIYAIGEAVQIDALGKMGVIVEIGEEKVGLKFPESQSIFWSCWGLIRKAEEFSKINDELEKSQKSPQSEVLISEYKEHDVDLVVNLQESI